jgi:hypothetical protein
MEKKINSRSIAYYKKALLILGKQFRNGTEHIAKRTIEIMIRFKQLGILLSPKKILDYLE